MLCKPGQKVLHRYENRTPAAIFEVQVKVAHSFELAVIAYSLLYHLLWRRCTFPIETNEPRSRAGCMAKVVAMVSMLFSDVVAVVIYQP